MVKTKGFFENFNKCFPQYREQLVDKSIENLPYLQMSEIADIVNEITNPKQENILIDILAFIDSSLQIADHELWNIIHVSFLEHLDTTNNTRILSNMSPNLRKEYNDLRESIKKSESDEELNEAIKKLIDDPNNYI